MKKINKFGLRQVALSIALVAISSSAFAQKDMLTNRFIDNWFIEIGAGAQVFEGQQDQRGDFGDRITPAFEVAIGKWITPSVGVRVQAYGLEGKGFNDASGMYIKGNPDANGLYEESFDYWSIHADYMVNLNNFFGGYKEKRVWQIIPYIGAGMAQIDGDTQRAEKHTRFVGFAGLINKFRINHWLDVNIEAKQMFANDGFDGNTMGSRKVDGMSTVTIGLTYKLGKSHFDKGITQDELDAAVRANSNAYNSRISALERELSAERSALERTRAELERARQQKTVETVEVTVAQPLAIFFTINSSKISQKEMVNLKYAAEVIKASDKKYQITGYADRQTGSVAYNDKLSMKRAENVYKALVDMGVKASQLEVVARQSNQVLFNDMYLDRVAIVEVSK